MDGDSDASVGDGGMESSELVSFVEDELIGDVAAMVPEDGSAPSEEQASDLQRYLCRYPNFTIGVYSLRSFEGQLCQGDFVDGLQMVGGAALLICHESDYEGFRESPCANNALDAFDLDEYDEGALVDAMAAEALVLAERYATARNPSFAVAKRFFCLLPSSMFGPAASVHDDFCAP